MLYIFIISLIIWGLKYNRKSTFKNTLITIFIMMIPVFIVSFLSTFVHVRVECGLTHLYLPLSFPLELRRIISPLAIFPPIERWEVYIFGNIRIMGLYSRDIQMYDIKELIQSYFCMIFFLLNFVTSLISIGIIEIWNKIMGKRIWACRKIKEDLKLRRKRFF